MCLLKLSEKANTNPFSICNLYSTQRTVFTKEQKLVSMFSAFTHVLWHTDSASLEKRKQAFGSTFKGHQSSADMICSLPFFAVFKWWLLLLGEVEMPLKVSAKGRLCHFLSPAAIQRRAVPISTMWFCVSTWKLQLQLACVTTVTQMHARCTKAGCVLWTAHPRDKGCGVRARGGKQNNNLDWWQPSLRQRRKSHRAKHCLPNQQQQLPIWSTLFQYGADGAAARVRAALLQCESH